MMFKMFVVFCSLFFKSWKNNILKYEKCYYFSASSRETCLITVNICFLWPSACDVHIHIYSHSHNCSHFFRTLSLFSPQLWHYFVYVSLLFAICLHFSHFIYIHKIVSVFECRFFFVKNDTKMLVVDRWRFKSETLFPLFLLAVHWMKREWILCPWEKSSSFIPIPRMNVTRSIRWNCFDLISWKKCLFL